MQNRSRSFAGGAAALLALCLASCSDPNHQVRLVALGDTPVLATGGAVRMVMQRTRSVGGGRKSQSPQSQTVICTEPSPDIAAALDTALQLSAKGGASGASGEAAANASTAEHITELAGRVPQVLALRDGLYHACQMYASGVLGQSAYALILSQYGNLLETLLAQEAPKAAASAAPSAGNASSPVMVTLGSGTIQLPAAATRQPAPAQPKPDAPSTTTVGTEAGRHALLVACISEYDPTRQQVDEHSSLLTPALCNDVLAMFVPRADGVSNSSRVQRRGNRPFVR